MNGGVLVMKDGKLSRQMSGVLRLKPFVVSLLAAALLLVPELAKAEAYLDDVTGLTWYYQNAGGNSAIIVNSGDNSAFTSAVDPAKAVGVIAVPAKIRDLDVVGIGERAFYNCNKITSIAIPNGVKGTFALNSFRGCSALVAINIPSGITAIGERAFQSCGKLASVKFPEALTSIGEYAFYGCSSLADAVLPSGIASIGGSAFYDCGRLTGDVEFPSLLQSIGEMAFYNCRGITGLYFAEADSTNATLAIGKSAFFGCTSVTNLYLPRRATDIREAAFQSLSSLSSARLPPTMTSIAKSLFTDCRSLGGLELPETLSSIGAQAFYYSTGLEDFAIPSNAASVGAWAFRSTKFWNDCPDNSIVVKDGWVLGVKGKCPGDAILANGVRHVAEGAFEACSSLTNVVISDAVLTVGARAFASCTNLAAVSVAKGVALDPTVFQGSNWLPDGEGGGEFVDPTLVITNFFVKFNPNGGIGNMATQTFRYGEAKALATNLFTRATYLFDGWATGPTTAVVYVDGQIVSNLTTKSNGTVNLYAHWTRSPERYYVALNGNGGVAINSDGSIKTNTTGASINVVTQTFAVGESQALFTNRFARANYDFKGWSTTATGEKKYNDGEMVLNLATNGQTVALFAKWEISESSIREQMVDGVLWHYQASGGEATIVNLNGMAAINTSTSGEITVPRELGGYEVTAIGDYAFYGCSSLTSVELPETITSIGDFAFGGCTSLKPGITIPENVESLGAYVFTNCPNLKIVRYWGECPDAPSELYAGTKSGLISGILRVRSSWETDELEIGGSATGDDETAADGNLSNTNSPSASEPVALTVYKAWPDGKFSRPVLPMTGVTVYALQFRTNSVEVLDEEDGAIRYYMPGRIVGTLGDLPVPEHSVEGMEFVGWFTSSMGGTQVTEDTVMDRSYVLYAHWKRDDQREATDWTQDLYEEEEPLAMSKAEVFDGYIYSSEGTNSEDSVVAGVVALKIAKGKYNREEEATNAAVTATVQLLGGGKMTLKGTLSEDGTAELMDRDSEHEMMLTVGQSGLVGTFDEMEVSGARNRFSSKLEGDVYDCKFALQQWQRTWTIVLPTEEAYGDGAALAHGVGILTVSVGAKGKTKVKGTLADGTKVSVATQLLVGDGCCCVPVVVPLYSGKKGGFAFLLWLSEDNEGVWGLSAWEASQRSGGAFTATFAEPVMSVAAAASTLGSVAFHMEDFFDLDGAEDAFTPDGTEIDATSARWKLPKADAVKFSKDDGWYVPDGKDYGNPAGLKLSYTARNGTFKGSFKVFAVTEAGRSKKYTANVSGVVIDNVGYGTALIKNVGSVTVLIGE